MLMMMLLKIGGNQGTFKACFWPYPTYIASRFLVPNTLEQQSCWILFLKTILEWPRYALGKCFV